MASEKRDWRFEFVVQEMAWGEAKLLWACIQAVVEKGTAGSVGGGYWPETHEEEEGTGDGQEGA